MSALTEKVPLPELARRWGWSQDALRWLVRRKAIPFLKIGGRIYFEVEALEPWLAARRGGDPVALAAQSKAAARAASRRALGLPANHYFGMKETA
jgi:hypothetical protein